MKKTIDANIKLTEMLELSDRDFKAAMMKKYFHAEANANVGIISKEIVSASK